MCNGFGSSDCFVELLLVSFLETPTLALDLAEHPFGSRFATALTDLVVVQRVSDHDGRVSVARDIWLKVIQVAVYYVPRRREITQWRGVVAAVVGASSVTRW